jgi:hypothetical protein
VGTISRNNWIDSGQTIYDKFMLVTKPHLLTIIPEAIEFNHGTLDLNPYSHKFVGKL